MMVFLWREQFFVNVISYATHSDCGRCNCDYNLHMRGIGFRLEE